MAVAVSLRYQGKTVSFDKSPHLVAVRARAGMGEAMHNDIEVLAPGRNQAGQHMVGAFEVIDLLPSASDIDRDLDWLRSRPAVAAGTHVFLISGDLTLYVPTGNIHLIFADGLPGHEQQTQLSRYRLQAIEARGDGDFLVSITTGTKNPIATAAALQQEAQIDVAEPEFEAAP